MNDQGKLDLILFALSKKLSLSEIEALEKTINIVDWQKRFLGCLAMAQAKTDAGTSVAGIVASLSKAKAAAENISDEASEAEAWALIARTETAAGRDGQEGWTKAWKTVEGISQDDQKEQVSSRAKNLETTHYRLTPTIPASDLKVWAQARFEAAVATEIQDYSHTRNRVLGLIKQHGATSAWRKFDGSLAQTMAPSSLTAQSDSELEAYDRSPFP